MSDEIPETMREVTDGGWSPGEESEETPVSRSMAATYAAHVGVVAEVLREHYKMTGNGVFCACGWQEKRGHDHAEHAAVVVLLRLAFLQDARERRRDAGDSAHGS